MTGTSVAAHVAATGEGLMVENLAEDSRFPEGIVWPTETPKVGEEYLLPKAVLAAPVVADEDGCIAVIELFRSQDRGIYARREYVIVKCILDWLGSCIFLSSRRRTLQKRHEVRERLLKMVQQLVSEEKTFAETLCSMLQLLKTTIRAELGSLFITDRHDSGLADLWQEALSGTEQEGKILINRLQKVVLKDEQPIVDEVIQSNEPVFINEVTSVRQFRTDRERMRGDNVSNVLLLPICGREHGHSAAVAVIVLMNKADNCHFTDDDVQCFRECAFTHFFGMVTYMGHVSAMCEQMIHEFELEKDLIKHHVRPCSHDMRALLDAGPPEDLPKDFDSFTWFFNQSDEEEYTIPQLIIYIMKDLFGSGDITVWAEFVLTVRNVYRKVPYHNFTHAFYVTHCTYVIIKKCQISLIDFEMKSLIVAALCIDLDHSGLNNNFLIHTKDCLARVSPMSPHENHHASLALLILDIFNIFPEIKSDKQKHEDFRECVRKIIIATDVENYFCNRRRILKLLRSNRFKWSNLEHRQILMELVVVTADLCVSCKPHPECTRNALCRKEEFLQQGDLEKELSMKPLPVMDRDTGGLRPADELALCQAVCAPSAELLSLLLPPLRYLLDMCFSAIEYWSAIVSTTGEWDDLDEPALPSPLPSS